MIRPYPWERLGRVSRAALWPARQLRELWGPSASTGLARWMAGCLGAGGGRVRLVRSAPLATAPRGRLEAAAVCVDLKGPDDQLAALLLDQTLASAISGGLLGAGDALPVQQAVSPGERGVIAYGVAWLLSELPLGSWYVAGTGAAGDRVASLARHRALVFEAVVLWNDQAGSAWLLVDDPATIEAAAARAMRPRQPASADPRCPPRLSSLPVAVAAVVGRFTLPLAEVAELGLSRGDIIVADACRPALAEEVCLEVGPGGFPATIVGHAAGTGRQRLQLRIDGPYEPQGAMQMAERDDAPTIANQLPLEVTVEIARITLTGQQVVALAEGDVLTLERPLGSAVDLRVSGRLMARGELVDVDGETGVRLLEIYE